MMVTSSAMVFARPHPPRVSLLLFFLILLSNWGGPFPVPSSRSPLLFASAVTVYGGKAYKKTYSKSCTEDGLIDISSTSACTAVWGDQTRSPSWIGRWQGGTLGSKYPCGCYSYTTVDAGDIGYGIHTGSSCGTRSGRNCQATGMDCFCEIPAPTLTVRNEADRPNFTDE